MATGDDTPRHPTGIIQQYADATGRTQTSVTGPKGHILVTTGRVTEPIEVWHSHDYSKKLATTRDAGRALRVACEAAGMEV